MQTKTLYIEQQHMKPKKNKKNSNNKTFISIVINMFPNLNTTGKKNN